MTHVDDAGPKVIAARAENWHCELCERTHPIGKHDPGRSWPPLAVRAPEPRPRDSDSTDIYRCLICGIHMFDTSPGALARHAAHIEAFQAETRRVSAAVMCVGYLLDEQGPCARCQEPCHRYGDQGRPLCDNCDPQANGPHKAGRSPQEER